MGAHKKWIYLGYIFTTLIVAWVVNQAALLAVGYFRWSNPKVLGVMEASQLAAFVVVGLAGFIYFRQPKVNTFSVEVVQEMEKVTWPAKKTTYLSTIVVVVMVIISAVILGAFDYFCTKMIGKILGA